MGEHAEAALWAEMNGIDPAEMSAEDWMAFYEDNKPVEPWLIHQETTHLLGLIDENQDEDEPVKRAEVLVRLFPDLPLDRAEDLVRGMEALASLPEPEMGDD